MILKFIDWVAAKVAKHGSAKNQQRLGVVMCLMSLPLFVVGFFVSEPFLVYQMSAAALFFTGLDATISSLPSEKE